MTIAGLLAWGVEAIKPIAPETAAREASILLAHVLGGPSYQLTLRRDEAANADVETRFREMIAKRLTRCPVQYLTGVCEFYGLKFKVGPGVLIPRPETELLVETALPIVGGFDRSQGHIVDVGTGSGCIAIAIAATLLQSQSSQRFHVTATDCSADALAIATENVRSHGVADAVSLLREDLFALPTQKRDALFSPCKLNMLVVDLLVSNPPYVTEAEHPALAPEVRDWEPKEALVSGKDGLPAIMHLIASGPIVVHQGGHILLEIGAGHAAILRSLDWERLGYDRVDFLKDLAGIERVLRARVR